MAASKFNDADFQTRVEVIGEVGICIAPKHYRSGPELKRWYWDTRPALTIADGRWSRSGQNDPYKFHKIFPQLLTERLRLPESDC
jgi:hypothetical protein